MKSPRSRPRIESLLIAVLFAALAFGTIQTWRRLEAREPSAADRAVSTILESRRSRPVPAAGSTDDAWFVAGIASAGVLASSLIRRSRRDVRPSPAR